MREPTIEATTGHFNYSQIWSPTHINTHVTYRPAPFTPERDEEEEDDQRGTAQEMERKEGGRQ